MGVFEGAFDEVEYPRSVDAVADVHDDVARAPEHPAHGAFDNAAGFAQPDGVPRFPGDDVHSHGFEFFFDRADGVYGFDGVEVDECDRQAATA